MIPIEAIERICIQLEELGAQDVRCTKIVPYDVDEEDVGKRFYTEYRIFFRDSSENREDVKKKFRYRGRIVEK